MKTLSQQTWVARPGGLARQRYICADDYRYTINRLMDMYIDEKHKVDALRSKVNKRLKAKAPNRPPKGGLCQK